MQPFNGISRIGKVLCDHMSVVSVTCTDEGDQASIFETLNDPGIGLPRGPLAIPAGDVLRIAQPKAASSRPGKQYSR